MDVAHFTTEVAQRCQLKLAGERDPLFPCFDFQITGESPEVLHLFSVLLTKIFDIFKTVQVYLRSFVLLRLFSSVYRYYKLNPIVCKYELPIWSPRALRIARFG